MKILLVDNNLHLKVYPQGLMVKSYLSLKNALKSKVKRPLELSREDINVDRVILTGSTAYVRQEDEWMKKEMEFISKWMKKEIPILGVCFGSQVLATYLFGRKSVSSLPVPMSGSIRFKHNGKCPLFKDLPKEFGVVSSHYENTYVPKKYRVGEAEDIDTYAFWYKPNVFGIQFHPELMGVLGRTLVKLYKFSYDRHIYQDFSVKTSSKIGRKILKNFIEL